MILDRDGVLIADDGYPHDPDSARINEGIVAFLTALRREGFRFGFATNQGGIGIGLYDWACYEGMENYLDRILCDQLAEPDFWLACGSHPRSCSPRLAAAHPWRKPGPGMILEALSLTGAAPANSIMIGDRSSDMEAARAAGIPGVIFSGDVSRVAEVVMEASTRGKA